MDLHSLIKYKDIFVLHLHTPSQLAEMKCFFQVLKEENSCRHTTHKLEQSLTKLWSPSFGAFSLCAALNSAKSSSSSVRIAVITLPYWLPLSASVLGLVFGTQHIFTAARLSQSVDSVFHPSWLSVEEVLQERH